MLVENSLLRDSQVESLQRVLGLLQVGHAQTNTPTRDSTQILEPPQLVTFNLFEVAS